MMTKKSIDQKRFEDIGMSSYNKLTEKSEAMSEEANKLTH